MKNLKTLKKGSIFVACALMIAITGCRENETPNQISQVDRDFARDAGHGIAAGIQSGELAGTRSQNADIVNFGQGNVTTQTEAQGRLNDIGTQNQIQIPSQANQHDQQMYDQLSGLQGHQFDSAYLHHYITATQNSIDMYRNHMHLGTHQGLRDFAGQGLTGMETDLARAQEIQGQLQATPAAQP